MHPGSGVDALAERLTGRHRLRWARAAALVVAATVGAVLPVLAHGLTGSVTVTVLVAAVEGLPYLFLGPPAATLARRVARRRLVAGAGLANAVLLAGTYAAFSAGTLPVPLLLGVAVAVQAVFVLLAAADDRGAPHGEPAGVARAVVLLVAALGAVAMAPVTPAFLLLPGSLACAACGVLVRSAVDPPAAGPVGPAAGRRAVRYDGSAGVPPLVGGALGFVAGVLVVELALSMSWVLGWSLGEAAIGVVFALWAIGGLAAVARLPAAAGRLGGRRLGGLLMSVAALVMFGWASAGHPLITAAAAGGWSVLALTLVLNSVMLRRQVLPEPLRRRAAMRSRRISLGIGWPLGVLACGAVDTLAGPGPALTTAAIVLAGGALAFWRSAVRG